MNPQTNSNNFFGIAVSLPGINVNQASPSQMMYTNDYSTTTWRDNNGNITLQEGLLSGGNYGLSAGGGSVILDANGLSLNPNSSTNSIQLTSTQLSVYEDGVEQIRIGLLPDGTYGMVITVPGTSVDQAYGG
jgi:hypothetical protein